MANRSRAGERKPRRGQARKLSVEMLEVAFSGATGGNRATRRANLSKLKVHNRASRKGVRFHSEYGGWPPKLNVEGVRLKGDAKPIGER